MCVCVCVREREKYLMIALYHQSKTLISFWCRGGLNPKSLIQPSKTLLVELTVTCCVTKLIDC